MKQDLYAGLSAEDVAMMRRMAGVPSIKVPVKEQALIKRINRRGMDGVIVKASRGRCAEAQVGTWYAVDLDERIVTHSFIDLEEWGYECGALKPYEFLELH